MGLDNTAKIETIVFLHLKIFLRKNTKKIRIFAFLFTYRFMNWEIVHHIVNHTLAITSFVMGMMMVIEFVNVRTGGLWSKKLQTSPWMQIVVGALMGVIPGCLGTYTIVSLYVHRVVTFPALMSTLIATTGDEAFFMFSSFPGKALAITCFLFVLSIFSLYQRFNKYNQNLIFQY